MKCNIILVLLSYSTYSLFTDSTGNENINLLVFLHYYMSTTEILLVILHMPSAINLNGLETKWLRKSCYLKFRCCLSWNKSILIKEDGVCLWNLFLMYFQSCYCLEEKRVWGGGGGGVFVQLQSLYGGE